MLWLDFDLRRGVNLSWTQASPSLSRSQSVSVHSAKGVLNEIQPLCRIMSCLQCSDTWVPEHLFIVSTYCGSEFQSKNNQPLLTMMFAHIYERIWLCRAPVRTRAMSFNLNCTWGSVCRISMQYFLYYWNLCVTSQQLFENKSNPISMNSYRLVHDVEKHSLSATSHKF